MRCKILSCWPSSTVVARDHLRVCRLSRMRRLGGLSCMRGLRRLGRSDFVIGRHQDSAPQQLRSDSLFQSFDPELHLVSPLDRKSTRLNSSHITISYAVFCLKKKI